MRKGVWEFEVLRCWHLRPFWHQPHLRSSSNSPFSLQASSQLKTDPLSRLTSSGHLCREPAKLSKPAGEQCRIQKTWDSLVSANQMTSILTRTSNETDKARLLAASSPHAGDWLHAPPIASVGLRLSDEAVCVAVAHRLGCKACEPHTCVCVVRQFYSLSGNQAH